MSTCPNCTGIVTNFPRRLTNYDKNYKGATASPNDQSIPDYSYGKYIKYPTILYLFLVCSVPILRFVQKQKLLFSASTDRKILTWN